MEKDLPHPALIASARQIMDIPEEDEMQNEDGPLTLTWYALGHAAVLLYLALHALANLSPMERGLAAGTLLLAATAAALLWRDRLRAAIAMAEVLAPAARAARPSR